MPSTATSEHLRVVDRGSRRVVVASAVSPPPAELGTFSRVFTTPRNLMDEIQMLLTLLQCANQRPTTTGDSRNTDVRTPWSVVQLSGTMDGMPKIAPTPVTN